MLLGVIPMLLGHLIKRGLPLSSNKKEITAKTIEKVKRKDKNKI